jgi:ferredoxin
MADSVTVTLRHVGQAELSFPCPTDETVLVAARRAGVILHVACEQGGCGACRARIVEGDVHYPLPASLRWLDEGSGSDCYALLCRAVPQSTLLVETAHPWKQRSSKPLSSLIGG